jgi:hypothetical protein
MESSSSSTAEREKSELADLRPVGKVKTFRFACVKLVSLVFINRELQSPFLVFPLPRESLNRNHTEHDSRPARAAEKSFSLLRRNENIHLTVLEFLPYARLSPFFELCFR